MIFDKRLLSWKAKTPACVRAFVEVVRPGLTRAPAVDSVCCRTRTPVVPAGLCLAFAV